MNKMPKSRVLVIQAKSINMTPCCMCTHYGRCNEEDIYFTLNRSNMKAYRGTCRWFVMTKSKIRIKKYLKVIISMYKFRLL